jgi:hypothetical protein
MCARKKAHMKKVNFKNYLFSRAFARLKPALSHHESRNAVLLAKLSALSAAAGETGRLQTGGFYTNRGTCGSETDS